MITLYRQQRVALAHLRINNAYALFMEQGTGKTLPTVLRILELLKSGKAQDALVVTVKAAMGAWWRTVEMLPTADQALLRQGMTVTSYTLVWRRKTMDRPWGVVVLDESHKIKNRTTKAGKFLLGLAPRCAYRYILTGTPISNGQLENLWSQYAFLEPVLAPRGQIHSSIFGGSYYDFLDRYAFLNKYHKPYRYRRVDEFQEILAEHCYRVTKAECLDLPEKLPDMVYDIELAEKALYKQMHRESAIETMDLLATNPLTRMLRLRQICSGFVDGRPLRCEKLNALDDLLDGWDKKLVIFCEFRHSIERVCGLLKKRKLDHVCLDGTQQDKNVWQRFQTEEALRVIVCQYQSANAGVDLYAADTILYYEPTLSSNILEQSRDRIHRIGQNQKCSYLHFITQGTVEEAIYKALQGYRDFGDRLFTEYMREYQKGVKW